MGHLILGRTLALRQRLEILSARQGAHLPLFWRLMAYQIQTFAVGAFQCNCSILFDEQSREALIIDPGDEPDLIIDRVHALGLTVKGLWHTHAHLDHIGATKALYEICSFENTERGGVAPHIFLHEGDRWLYENVALQSKFLGLHPFDVRREFELIKEGQGYEGFKGVRALHTPGHTPGSCCLAVGEETAFESTRSLGGNISHARKVLLSGDTLFRRGIGRTDLWGGDSTLILKSIQRRLLTLDADTLVIPGHGPITFIEEEAAKNPFLS